ncbi:MAG: T9SS type A sorting domain-containing protein [Bacteroidota bacterium]
MKKSKTTALVLLFFLLTSVLQAQPFTKKYIMSFHTCDSNCTSFQDHLVNLTESEDGSTWTLVPNFIPYGGSVPDVIIRGNKLYIYTPGKVLRYDKTLSAWDAAPVMISIQDSAGGNVNFVDPSAFVDDQGRLVLFFLNSTGIQMGQDPAGCQTYPCYKFFDSAIEVAGSDGTQFIMQSGRRAVINLPSSGSASDPDIFFDGTKYIMYISRGGSTYACQSDSLHGTYTAMPDLSNGMLTYQGGIPCGNYDSSSGNYWTYVHSNVSGNTVIRQAIHTGFNALLNTFNTVISGPIIGEPSTTKTESPGFCTNDFLYAGITENESGNFKVYPNPANSILTIQLKNADKKTLLEIFDISGLSLLKKETCEKNQSIDISGFTKGMYLIRIENDNKIGYKKFVVM